MDYAAEPPQEGADTLIGVTLTFAAYVKRIPPHLTIKRQSMVRPHQRRGGRLEIVSDSGEWTRVRYGGQ